MKSFKRVGLVVAVGAAFCLPAGTADAATTPSPETKDCGDTGKIRDITANRATCSKAKAVAKRWKSLCNYAGRCAVEGGSVGAQWVCKGKRSGSRLRETCTGGASKGTVKFKAPA